MAEDFVRLMRVSVGFCRVEHMFGRAAPFALGVEEELLLVEPGQPHRLDHGASAFIARVASPRVKPDVYEGIVEGASSICSDAPEAAAQLEGVRGALRDAGATLAGAGLHPDAPFGDVVHVKRPRYEAIHSSMRGLLERTPTCALHVHVGMTDPETAIVVCNRLRSHLPLLQALAAHSPYWHGRDAGFATARAQLFRGFPRAEIPRAFADWNDYASTVEAAVAAGGLADYTYLWWDIRPSPALGTVEVRAMDAQARLTSVCGLAALVRALAAACADGHGTVEPSEALSESSFRAGRDGRRATIWWDGALRPLSDVAAAALALARPYARDLRDVDALEEIERILRDGNGADRMRAAHAAGGMNAVLERLIREAAEPLYGYTRTTSPIRTHL
jgi:glutamate---cysteine ligase / carboxylate-amine ligase